MNIPCITDFHLKNQTILIRSDFNVPIQNNKVICDIRIQKSISTINFALKSHAKSVIVASHLGRPKDEKYNEKYSLQPIVKTLQKYIHYPVRLVRNYLNGLEARRDELLVLENVRFNKGEKNNDTILSKKYANLCDIFVMDAFGASHRLESSTYGIIKFAPQSCIGILFKKEIKYLKKVLTNSERPIVTILGGSKIATKFNVIKKLSNISDKIIIGGGIANTFLLSQGYSIGKSLKELNYINKAKMLLKIQDNLVLPKDVKIVKNNQFCNLIEKPISKIDNEDYIVDIGNNSCKEFIKILNIAKTIFWNGPLGCFEFNHQCSGTKKIAQNIVKKNVLSIIGGGETILAAHKFGILNLFSYISTGGGALLKFIENQTLPSLLALENSHIR